MYISALPLRYNNQPANKLFILYVLLRGTAVLILIRPRFFLSVEFFYSANLSLHNFFLLNFFLLIRKKKDIQYFYSANNYSSDCK